MDVRSIIAAVVGVVNAPIPQRPPALAPLAYLKCPRRELRSRLDSERRTCSLSDEVGLGI